MVPICFLELLRSGVTHCSTLEPTISIYQSNIQYKYRVLFFIRYRKVSVLVISSEGKILQMPIFFRWQVEQ